MADESGSYAGLAAVGTLAVGVLGAVGVGTDALSRLVRNDGMSVASPVGVGVAVVAFGAIHQTVSAKADADADADAEAKAKVKGGAKAVRSVVIAVVAGALIVLVCYGSTSLDDREQPVMSVSLAPGDAGEPGVVTVTASGSSMKLDDIMLVRVVALGGPADPHSPACLSADAKHDAERTGVEGQVLVYNQSGSNPKGESSVEVSAPLPSDDGFTHVCVFVVLSLQDRSEVTFLEAAAGDAAGVDAEGAAGVVEKAVKAELALEKPRSVTGVVRLPAVPSTEPPVPATEPPVPSTEPMARPG